MADNKSAPLGLTHLGIALVFAVFWAGLGSLVVEGAKHHDFLNLYTGATLAAEGRFAELHDPDVQFALERELVSGVEELVPFVRPQFYALLLSPLSLFSLDTAMAVWLCLHSALLLGLWYWGARTFGADALILGAMFLPAALGIAHGQDGVLMMTVVAGSWTLARKGRDGFAGAVLALGLAKFHLLLCVPLALVLARRWIMLRGFALSGAGLAVFSVALGGWTGAEKYVALLRMKDLRRLSPSPELMINVHSIGANFDLGGTGLSAVLVCFTLVLLAVAVWKAPLERLYPAMLVASLLVPPHVYAYDAALLLPALWLTCFRAESRFAKMTSGVLVSPVVYLAGLAGSPWSALTSFFLFGFLAAHAAEQITSGRTAAAEESAAAA